MKLKRVKRWYGVVTAIALIFLVLTVSIAAPLVCRPFYYAHIQALHLPETTGFTEEEIREAYDEMMDFCMKGEEFGTGVMKWSEDGKSHFADCAVLFRLDFQVMAAAVLILVLCLILYLRGYRPKLLCGRGPLFWAGAILMGGFLVIAALGAADFDRAFVIFHHIFFPGKTNWIFYYDVDEIIQVLPEVFFRNCAILIIGLMFILCILEIVLDFRIHNRKHR